MNAGYSGTPLIKKLGINPGFKMLLHNEPPHYFDLLGELPAEVEVLDKPASGSADFIHLFCTTAEELSRVSIQYKDALKKEGMMWVSWPKGTSAIVTDLKREPVRDLLLNIGLVDVKVAAVDKDWSGLRFVYKLRDR